MQEIVFRTLRVALAVLYSGVMALPAVAAGGSRTILILDGSGSMWGQIEGEAKITIARRVIDRLLDSLPADEALGLYAYGHREEGNCADIEALVPAASGNADAIRSAVQDIKPKGKTPLSDSVAAAAEELKYQEDKATVILVSDGRENCGRDPCSVARALEESGADFTAHVVGFDVADPEDIRQLSCIAEETGGRFLTADTADELVLAMSAVQREVTEETSVRDDRYYAEMLCGPSPSVRSGDLLKAYLLDFSSGHAVSNITGTMRERLDWRIDPAGTVSVSGEIYRQGRHEGDVRFRGTIDSGTAEIPGSVADRNCTLSLWRMGAPTNPMGWLEPVDGDTLKRVLTGNTARAVTWAKYFSPDGLAQSIVRFYGAEVTDRYSSTWSTTSEQFCGVQSGRQWCQTVYGAETDGRWRLAWLDQETGAVWVADIVEGNQLP